MSLSNGFVGKFGFSQLRFSSAPVSIHSRQNEITLVDVNITLCYSKAWMVLGEAIGFISLFLIIMRSAYTHTV